MMQRAILASFFLLLQVSGMLAQDEETPLYTRAGFKTGINLSNVSGEIDNSKSRIRLHLGAVIEFPVSPKFFVQPEVLFSAQGYVTEEAGVENKISLTYLSLPILLKYNVAEAISLESGPQFSTLTTTSNSIGDESDRFFNSFNNFDFSWSLGAGYKLESGMFFQLRYTIPLLPIQRIEMQLRNYRSDTCLKLKIIAVVSVLKNEDINY